MTKEYKEGDYEMTEPEMNTPEVLEEPTVAQLPLPSTEETKNEKPPKNDKAIYTAVLLLQYENGRIDAITDLPNMDMDHQAGIREVRNICQSMFTDSNNMIQSKIIAHEMQMAAAQQQLANQIEGFKNKLKV